MPKLHGFHTLDPQLHWKPVHLSLSGGHFRLVFQGSCQNLLAGTEIDQMRGSESGLQQHPSSLLRQADAPQKFSESRIGAHAVELRIHFEIDQRVAVLRISRL